MSAQTTNGDDGTFAAIVVGGLIALALLAVPVCVFTDICKQGNEDMDRKAQRAVEAFGFSDVQMEGGFQTGSWINGCDSHDSFARRFTATNQRGQNVRGVACGGFFKEWTVRVSN